MGLTFMVGLIILAIVAVVALDLLGLGWVIRKVWRSISGRR